MGKKTIIKNIFSSLITQSIRLVYGLIIPALIIGHFGSNVNGLISSITQFLAYITLLEGGIGPIIKNALFKPLVNKDKNELANILETTDKFFKIIAYVFLIYILILCFIYPYIVSNQFDFIFTLSLLIIISISNFFEYFVSIKYKLFLQSDQKNYIIDNINLIGYILNLIVIILLVNLGFNIQIIKLVSAFVYLIKPLLLKKYFKKYYDIKPNKNSKYKLEKKWDGLTHHLAATIQSNTDIVILTIFNSLTNVSIYAVYALVTNSLRSIIISLTNGIDAFFGKLMVEKNNDINQKFNRYSAIFYTLITIILSSALILIIPFVSVYTKGVHDANYIQPIFAYLLIFAEFNFVIRYPYSTIVYAKGHFKETRNFSIIEPIVNIIISVVLVYKFGLIGVAIGTLISTTIRSFGFIIYASKNILNVSIKKSLFLVFLSLVEMLIYFGIHILIGNIFVKNYFEWFILALIVFIIVTVVTIIINSLFYIKDLKLIYQKLFRKKVKI